MKRVILGALALLCLASCSYRVYPVDALVENYKLAMQTPEEVAAQENVAVFLSEQDVPGPYKLIAFVENPSPVSKDILKKAVLKADEMGGNAVIVNSARSFKVIELSGRPPRKAAPPREVRPQPRPRPEPRVAPAPREKAPAKAERKEPAGQRIREEGGKLIDKVKSAPIFQKDESKAEARAAAKEEAAKARAAEAEASRAKAAADKEARAAEAAAAREKAAADKAARDEAARIKAEEARAAKAEAEKARAAEAEAARAKAAAEKAAKAEVAKTAAPAKSAILDDSTLQWFTSGYVYRAKEQEQNEIIDAMISEIKDNLKNCKTQAEADFISKKIDQLEKYNKALPIPSGTLANRIKSYRNTIKKLEDKF